MLVAGFAGVLCGLVMHRIEIIPVSLLVAGLSEMMFHK